MSWASTTLSDSKFDFLQLQHPVQIVWLGDEEVSAEYLGHHRSRLWEREVGLTTAPTFALEKTVGDRRQDDVAFPAGPGAAFEMIQPDLVFEFLILLLDRPALMCEAREGAERGRRRQVHQVVLRPRRRAEVAFAQQPDFGREAAVPPIVRGSNTGRTEPCAPRRIRPVAPRHESPPTRRLRGGPSARIDRDSVRRQMEPRSRSAFA